MGRLTSAQLAAIIARQPIRQTWAILSPTSVLHTAYNTTMIDDTVSSGSSTKTVIKAGRRTLRVWNPHPMESARPSAVRYSIEVANASGQFFHGASGSVWNPFGTYDAAPQECYLEHRLYIWDNVAGAWSEVTHMAFTGLILSVDYTGSAAMTMRDDGGGLTSPTPVPYSATINSEQDGAWTVLRHVFNRDDGTIGVVTDGTSGNLTFTTP